MSQLIRAVPPKVIGERNVFSRPIVDIKRIKCIGGKGGDGAVVFSKHGAHKLVGPGLPVGGAGGKGGDVFIAPMDKHDGKADLRHIPGCIRAQNGYLGGNRASGKPGKDVILKVPLGTLVYRFDPQDDPYESQNWRQLCDHWNRKLIADINDVNQEKVTLALGGSGGRGNSMNSPYEAQYGFEPQEAYYEVELKSIADVGLLGLPNVGKSTLLSALTRANCKIAAYPFTTIKPCIGHVQFTDGASISIADLPGIVECRFTQDFFRHIERTKALLYVIDSCNITYASMEDHFSSLRQQVEAYGAGLADKPFAIVITKMDLHGEMAARAVDSFCHHLRYIGLKNHVIPISAKFGLGTKNLVKVIRDLAEKVSEEITMRMYDDCDNK